MLSMYKANKGVVCNQGLFLSHLERWRRNITILAVNVLFGVPYKK